MVFMDRDLFGEGAIAYHEALELLADPQLNHIKSRASSANVT